MPFWDTFMSDNLNKVNVMIEIVLAYGLVEKIGMHNDKSLSLK